MTATERLNKTLAYLHSVNKPVTIKQICNGIGDSPASVASIQYVLSDEKARKYFNVNKESRGYLYSLSALGHCTQKPVDLDESTSSLVYLFTHVLKDREKEFKMMRV